MKVGVGADHGGFEMKQQLAKLMAALCHDDFSARQGVEDDNMNVLCFGGRTTGIAVAWDCTKSFLGARFSGAERHRRRLAKVTEIDNSRIAHADDHKWPQSIEPPIIGDNNDVA
jgi:ribose 5-phosphate isomerase B